MFEPYENPVGDYEMHCLRQEREAMRFPICHKCGNPITDDELWDIHGDLYCEECAEEEFRRYTDDYVTEVYDDRY